MDGFDYTLIDWSRAQFALTAMYHWMFVPITLGITFIIAIMETLWVKTGKPVYKQMTKFWMTLFGINFAIGVATGIILEFEFGTNWSNYSWFVGDIFGAPLAIEGIFAFFLESTFIAVMFFGWNKVSPKFHLLSTWLVAFGASLSALWILVANAWMQYPAGMHFNPITARNEMLNFWEVFLSPVAINKFLHTILSSYTLASLFVIGVSSWFLLKKRHLDMAKRSIVVAAIFGLTTSIMTVFTGDHSARLVAEKQPMKFAAMEGLYKGQEGAGLIALGVFTNAKNDPDNENLKDFAFKIEIPNVLSYMAFLDWNAFVPGIEDLIKGNEAQGIPPVAEKVRRGRIAIESLKEFKEAHKAGNDSVAAIAKENLEANFKYFGYGYFENAPERLIPNVPLSFYSFHIMVGLGMWFVVFFMLVLLFIYRNQLQNRKFWLRMGIINIPLAFIASQAGWVLAEVGRQPWVIQDIMPTLAAVSQIDANSVIITFIMFAVLFTVLMIAEIRIMLKQIKIGPKDGGH